MGVIGMKKNRKKAETYRFNGNPFLHPRSIHPIRIEELEGLIKGFEAKLANPNDPDDKKWTARWLQRFKRELSKKKKGRALKEREKPRQ
jgi:hypothetical protein